VAGAPIRLRPLTVGEIADRGVSLYRRDFRLLFTISFLAQLVVFLFTRGYLYLLAAATPAGEPGLAAIPLFLFWPLLLLLAWVLGLVATGAVTWAAARRYLGEEAGIGGAIGMGLRKLIQLFLTVFLATLCWGFALVAGLFPGLLLMGLFVALLHPVVAILLLTPTMTLAVAPGFFLFLRFLFAGYIPTTVMTENLWGPEALVRSWRLMGFRSPTWRMGEWSAYRATALFLLVLALLLSVLSLTSIPYLAAEVYYGVKYYQREGAEEAAMNPMTWGAPVALILPLQLLNVAGQALLTPFMACAFVIFYFDLRVRKEGYDLFRELQALPPAAP